MATPAALFEFDISFDCLLVTHCNASGTERLKCYFRIYSPLTKYAWPWIRQVKANGYIYL